MICRKGKFSRGLEDANADVCKWNDDGKVFQDDGSPGNYSTSVIGYECDHRTILFYSYRAFKRIITIIRSVNGIDFLNYQW